MRGAERQILLADVYDAARCYAVWSRFNKIYDGSGLSRRKIFVRMQGAIEDNLDRIKKIGDPKFNFEYPNIDAERKLISEFAVNGYKRKFKDDIWHLFDAYVQLTTPKFLQMLKGRDDLDTMGQIVGHFLKDPIVGDSGYVLEQASQEILHFYHYDNVDNIGLFDESDRYVCLFRSASPEYLFVMDFEFDGNHIGDITNERLRLYYGFCVPGEEFSPIIMRSFCLRERLAGLFFAPAAMVGKSSEFLNKLKFQVFTTDRSFHGNSKDNDEYGEFTKLAMSAHKGPTLTRNLAKVDPNSSLYERLNLRVKQFKVELL